MPKSGPSRRSVLIGSALLFSGLASQVWAQAKSRVKFAKGNDNTAVNGAVAGKQYKDYLLGAKAGQTMGVSLITDGSAFFNILPPGSNDVAIYNSSIYGNDATNVRLPKSGDYTIRVYLMGQAEEENVPVPYTLSMTIM
jgi:hypothetical protein